MSPIPASLWEQPWSAATARCIPAATWKNAALGSTICAERTACCKAVSEGHREFRRIAIYADSENWCTPCGACRQFLAEFSPDMEVLCAKAGDRYVSYKLSELLPYTFNY